GTIVVGRGGWLRLPQEFLDRAGIGSRAAASLEGDRIVVVAAGEAHAHAEEPPRAASTDSRGPVASVVGVAKTHGTGAGAARVFENLDASFAGGRLTVG